MNLVIDIGNTAAKIAVFDETKLVEVFYENNHSLDGLHKITQKYPLQKGAIASVVTLTDDICSQLEKLGIRMLHVNSSTPVPITNSYKTPHTLGVDRLAAVVAANELMPGRDLLVIDAGTCITYDFIDAKGEYKGGNISPGLHMRLNALHEFTDKLPLVSQEGDIPYWGDTTETAIRAGVIHGVSREIEGYIRQTEERHPSLFVVLTGGDGEFFETNKKSTILVDKYLVLKGLNRILNYNDTLS
ncbi:MAG: type III pantothenate kinase [Bacteroidaceae bacterium]|nr:type III pantothenate kinase [Bacteroidaceae bacterium]